MQKSNDIVYLEIYNWIGISLGAIHYYGKFVYKNGINEISSKKTIYHRATKRNAEYKNKYLREQYTASYYELYKLTPGDMTDGFDSREEVIQEAIKQWKKEFTMSALLVDYDKKGIIYASREIENSDSEQ